MKYLLVIIFLGLLFSIKAYSASITEELSKLNDLYKSGALTDEEFSKAKSILLNETGEKIIIDAVGLTTGLTFVCRKFGMFIVFDLPTYLSSVDFRRRLRRSSAAALGGGPRRASTAAAETQTASARA